MDSPKNVVFVGQISIYCQIVKILVPLTDNPNASDDWGGNPLLCICQK